ncbi:MAG: ABC transporter ATP-binding protein, partial [Betaproteobacteria bacterium]|nr:ABC transporter ATP-binding protein [Betaproteobacteria bacterium]
LDIETLDLLESLLAEYNGTLFLVSHDRAFLDNVVTQVIVLDGQGGVTENAGGYSDWTRYLENRGAMDNTPQTKPDPGVERTRQRPEKMSYKEVREMESLPVQIETLEAEQAGIATQLADSNLYKGDPERLKQLQARHAEIEQAVEDAMARWTALEQKQARLNANTL